MNKHWQASNDITCGEKKVFLTWGQAAQFARQVRGKGSALRAKGKKLERLAPYRCLRCQKFHLGHPLAEQPPRLSRRLSEAHQT